MDSEPSSLAHRQLQAVEHQVELGSAALKKELRLLDLVGIQILNIVGLYWVGTAGRLGSSHVMFWIPAVLFAGTAGCVLSILANVGTGNQKAFQLLDNSDRSQARASHRKTPNQK